MKIKKFFLLIPILIFLVGCEYSPAELNSKIVFDVNIETDEVSVDDKIAWSVVFVTDEFLSEYEFYVEPISNERGEHRIAILPYITMREFQWIEVGNIITDDVVGIQHYKKSALDSVGDLSPGVPFVARHWELGTFAHRGISFLDEHGERRYFAISFNQAPDERAGNFIIIEFDGK